jgi:CheY-like chemotaxis protein
MNVSSYLTKPIRQSTLFDAIATAYGPAEAPSPVRTAAVEHAPTVRPLEVLLADDNPVNQMTATTMLEKLGHTVVLANNGREAVAKVNEKKFDIVFMDVQMPEMDGFAASGEIRQREEGTGRHVPIIAMTAHAMKGDKEKCLQAGMDDYIAKPIRRKELAEVIARVADRFLSEAKPAAVTPAQEENGMILDEAALLEECDNDKQMLQRMIEMFDRDASQRLTKLREAARSGNASVLKQEGHALKGGIGIFYARAAYDTAYELEKMGAEGNVTEAEGTLSLLERHLQALRKRLDELVHS